MNRAALRHKVRSTVERALSRLPAADQRVVLEDLLYAIEKTGEASATTHQANGSDHEESLWTRIEAYCKAHPTKDGIFDPGVVGRALLPDELPGTARTNVYITVKRKSPQSDRGKPRDPRFKMVEGGKFRLLHETQQIDDLLGEKAQPQPQGGDDDIPF